MQSYAQTAVLGIGIITQMELIVGCRDKKELQSLTKFFKQFEILPINEQISKKSVKLLERYRLSHGLFIPDSLIAAPAIENEDFITKNRKDFKFINGLRLLPYP